MSNKETLQSYNTKLTKNNTSLDSILESINKLPENKEVLLQDKEVTPSKEVQTITSDDGYDALNQVTVNPIPNSYVEPSGTLGIVENGEYDVKNYEKAIVSVGESAESIKSLNELKTAMTNQIINFNDYLINKHSDTYEAYTTEPVTLYAPTSTHKHYVIRQRGTTNYGILWFQPTYLRYSSNTMLQTAGITTIGYFAFGDGTLSEANGSYNTVNNAEIAYTSSSYSSIDECINAMKNPNTTYTLSSSGSNWSIKDYRDSGGKYIVPCTNLPYFNGTTLGSMQRISSDETILVIGE